MPYVCCSPLWFEANCNLKLVVVLNPHAQIRTHSSSSWNSISFAMVRPIKNGSFAYQNHLPPANASETSECVREISRARALQSKRKKAAVFVCTMHTHSQFHWQNANSYEMQSEKEYTVKCHAENEKRWKNKSLHQSAVAQWKDDSTQQQATSSITTTATAEISKPFNKPKC